jgi:hypothetical protein
MAAVTIRCFLLAVPGCYLAVLATMLKRAGKRSKLFAYTNSI